MSCNVRTMSNDASEHPQSGPRCRTDASVLGRSGPQRARMRATATTPPATDNTNRARHGPRRATGTELRRVRDGRVASNWSRHVDMLMVMQRPARVIPPGLRPAPR